eukprot:CAMPEP_0168203720 /NCGR_PEP_ID=MMETSP0139_2-20121125/25004_1 /TAXON_ID=44445 /ORGANISM="Pseudo-nitzschia australis, Strain 10249 10 AB" /LENGTH=272 /DNA_ID=CAMNT_0008129589 /DNA_START=233 /DNA_END=1050 /DNA_ORIENTATION=+
MQFCNPSYSRPPQGDSVNLDEFSYQNPDGGSNNYNYGDDGSSQTSEGTGFLPTDGAYRSYSGDRSVGEKNAININGASLPHMRGDASIRPNTGHSNQTGTILLGSLREITLFLRWGTIGSTVAAIVWEGAAYLGIFCVLILGAEFDDDRLKDNFGFLYDPLSRGSILLMMSGMSICILNSWWESLLGLAFLVVGSGYIYTYIRYPEYRRWQNYNEQMSAVDQEVKTSWRGSETAAVTTAAWANPNNTMAEAAAVIGGMAHTVSETRSLLVNV